MKIELGGKTPKIYKIKYISWQWKYQKINEYYGVYFTIMY